MKKVSIVVDDYKLKKFKEELAAQGYADIDTKPFVKGTTSIFIKVAEDKVSDISRLCKKLELHFKRSN